MHVTTTTKWAACAALILAGLPATAMAAPSAPVSSGPGGPAAPPAAVAAADAVGALATDDTHPRSLTAQQALAAVRDMFSGTRPGGPARGGVVAGDPDRDPTTLMVQLTRQLDQLSPSDRRLAESYLARPTDGAADPDNSGYEPDATVTTVCGTNVCITRDANATNSDFATAGQVTTTMNVMDNVWNRIVTQGRYKAPKPDSGLPDQGPNAKLDVYLANIGNNGLYGYCNIDGVPASGGNDAPGYCVLDNDYSTSEFPSHTPLENLQVTAAHEFFHAVQFAYDFAEDRWFMEGTAAWMEDEIYDNVNDNLYFLQKSQLTDPTKSLDFYSNNWHPYGSWVWWRFLSEYFPAKNGTGLPVIIKRVWTKADDSNPSDPGTYSLKAAARAIAAEGSSFTRVYAAFGEANRHPERSYSEGASYPTAPVLAHYKLSRSKRTFPEQVATMPHLTNFSVAIKAGDGLARGKWKLRVNVDAPNKARGSFAQLTVYKSGGGIVTKVIKLSKKGVGSRTTPFNSSKVARVELTLTNAGQHYRCNRGTVLSCSGKPLDQNLKTYFKARVFK